MISGHKKRGGGGGISRGDVKPSEKRRGMAMVSMMRGYTPPCLSDSREFGCVLKRRIVKFTPLRQVANAYVQRIPHHLLKRPPIRHDDSRRPVSVIAWGT